MKIAAAQALAELAREDVPDEVAAAYRARPSYGPDYIIPVPFDPRLISSIRRRWRKRRWSPASRGGRSWTWMPTCSNCARGATRSPPCCSAYSNVCAAAQARGVCRRRRRAGDPRRRFVLRRARHGAAGRPRGTREGDRDALGVELGGGIEILNARLSRATRPMRRICTSGCSGAASCTATASGWSTTTAIISPPACWRWAMPTPW